MAQPRWKQFEELAADIQRQLAPDAKVTRNERIPGRKSGALREVDICVHQKVGQYDILIVMDCKDLKRPVDLPEVGAFIDLVGDVGAHRGAMISGRGFTKSAKQRATEAGIDLFRVVDAEKHDWQSYVSMPVLCRVNRIETVQYGFQGIGGVILAQDPRSFAIYDEHGAETGCVHDLLVKKWNAGTIPDEPGEHAVTLTDEKSRTRYRDQLNPIVVEAIYTVRSIHHLGHVRITDVKGFGNEVTHVLSTREFRTEEFTLERVLKEWREIKNPESLAISVVIKTCLEYPMWEELSGST